MLEKLLIICCYFNYHPKTRLVDVKIGFGPSGKIEKIECKICKKDYIRDPHVLVLVKTYRVSNVTVMGQVGSPGLIDLPAERRLDILSGIAQAGGFTKLARTSKIDLTRAGVTQTYDLEKLKKETNPAKKIWLSPDDLIYVHESAF